MPSSSTTVKMAKLAALACLLVCSITFSNRGRAQNPQDATSPASQEQTDVLRVYTQLVQTDVMVFDKQGRFVNGLKSSDFELRIDGKVRPVDFFEKVTSGSVNEELLIAAARGSSKGAVTNKSGSPAPFDRGRPIFFYVDDLHLDLASSTTAKKLITRFIDDEMGQNDEAAISSASGQIGFLQQLTDNKTVLHAALERLKPRPYTVRDFESPAMSEYQALLITNYNQDLLDYFIDETIKRNPGMTQDMAESMVKARANSVVQQAAPVTANTLAGLERLIRGVTNLPGRKLVFFISGGFFIDDRTSDARYKLQRITSAAARSGVVIYSMDARGLVASVADITSSGAFDPTGRVQNATSGELVASQDSMSSLAADTGGKAVFNTNSLGPGLGRTLKETSSYYLLAWKPEEAQRSSKFRRIEVKVIGKPNLTVLVRRGFFDKEPEPSAQAKNDEKNEPSKKEANKDPVQTAEAQLRKMILAPYPSRDIPVSLSLTYLNTPDKGAVLSAAMQVPNEFLSFAPAEGKETAVVSVQGTVFDDRGRGGAGFKNRITIAAPTAEAAKDGRNLTYGFPVYITPGLYQVRVGVRDEKTGRTGTAHAWIEIPNLAPGQLALSSLLLGLRPQSTTINASATPDGPPNPVDLSITHAFSADGYLRFMVFVYNAALAANDAKPDVAIQVQIVRDGLPVVTTALRKVSTVDIRDLARLPYAAEVSLNGLPSGRYRLQVTVVDRVTKKSATQQSRFEIN